MSSHGRFWLLHHHQTQPRWAEKAAWGRKSEDLSHKNKKTGFFTSINIWERNYRNCECKSTAFFWNDQIFWEENAIFLHFYLFWGVFSRITLFFVLFLFLLFRGIKSRKLCLFSPNLTHFFQNICIYQKKALPLHHHLATLTDGEPTVNRQSRLTLRLCQAKNEPI